MDEQAMLTRDLVLRICANATEFDLEWLGTEHKAVAPFTAARDIQLIRAIIAAGQTVGAERLLVCRTRAEYAYEPVTEVATDTEALIGLIQSWGKERTDFLVAVEDMSAAILVTASRLTVAAGPPDFVRQLVGPDIAQARADYAAEARASRDADLVRAAHRYNCLDTGARHARGGRGPGPDLTERFARRAEERRTKNPGRVGLYRAVRGLWAWIMLVLLLLSGIFVPGLSALLPITLGMVWLLVQLAWLARSRTVRFAALTRMLALGALMSVPMALAEFAVAGAVGLPAQDPYAYAYIGVPVEEVGKLVPLILLWLVARRRYKRFAAVDYLLLAAASGAGFYLAEQVTHMVVFHGADFFVRPDLGLFTILPGGIEAQQAGLRFSGHAVTTALVGAALGLAAVGWRRYGAWLWALPPLALGMAALEHMNFNALLAGLTPTPLTVSMFTLAGSGYATRWVLLLLLVVAVLMDHRMMRTAEDVAPRLPGRAPLADLTRWAHGRAIRLRVRVPGDYAPFFRWIALTWARLPVTLVEALAVVLHEFAVLLSAASRGPSLLYRTWWFLPRRREFAIGAARAGDRSWRQFPSRDTLSEVETRIATELGVGPKAAAAGAALAVLAVLWLPLPLAGETDPVAGAAYAAATFSGAAEWLAGLSPAARAWVWVALVALVSLLASGWSVPRTLPSARLFLREPHRHFGVWLGALAPGQVAYGIVALVGMALPGSVDRSLRPARRW